jgi:hypothetical protein
MRTRAIALFLLYTFIAAAQDLTLVGRWRSVESSKGGIGAMYDFTADGTAHFSPGAIVPSQYYVEGDRLSFYPPDGVPFTLSWTDDDHMQMSANGVREDYTRHGNRRDPQNRLLGEWTGMRDMGGQKVLVHWTFNADSNAMLMIRFTTQTGTYSLQNGRLMMSIAGKTALDGTVTYADGVLSINRSGGRVTKLARY